MTFRNLGIAEYVAKTSDFPNIRHSFGYSIGTKFGYPDVRQPGSLLYIFDTSKLIGDGSSWKLSFPQELLRFNDLLTQAKIAGYNYLVIDTEASFAVAKRICDSLLATYKVENWTPPQPDFYTDGGYVYSEESLRKTPAFKYLADALQNHQPPIYIDSESSGWKWSVEDWLVRQKTTST